MTAPRKRPKKAKSSVKVQETAETVGSVFQKVVLSFSPEEKLSDALRFMREHDFSQVVVKDGRSVALLTVTPPTKTGGSPPSRTPTSGHNIVNMNGREAAPPKKTGGTSSAVKFDPTSGHNVVQMSGRNLPKAARSDVPLQAGGPFDGAELCQCDKGNGWCLWINNRCTAGTEAPWNCDGVCKESKKK